MTCPPTSEQDREQCYQQQTNQTGELWKWRIQKIKPGDLSTQVITQIDVL